MASSKLSSTLDRRVVPTLSASDAGVLPLDAMYEILLRLPAKDLCRLRAVCRPWRCLLSNSQFITAHGARHPGPLIISSFDENVEHASLVDIMDLSGQSIKRVRREKGDWVVSMVSDLVCVMNSRSGMCRLLNLATGVVHHLPQYLAEQHVAGELEWSDYLDGVYGFAQVATTGEYKVFRVLQNRWGEDLFEVCTLNSGSRPWWRVLQSSPSSFIPGGYNIVVIDGVIFFLREAAYFAILDGSLIEQEWIISFDLKTEEWRPNIRGPNTFVVDGDPSPMHLTLANLNGCLVIVHGTTAFLDLWFLMDIEKGLWVKQYSLQVEQSGRGLIMDPLMVLGDRRLVVRIGYMTQIHDPRTNTFTDVLKLRHCCGTSMYTGNLLSLDGQSC